MYRLIRRRGRGAGFLFVAFAAFIVVAAASEQRWDVALGATLFLCVFLLMAIHWWTFALELTDAAITSKSAFGSHRVAWSEAKPARAPNSTGIIWTPTIWGRRIVVDGPADRVSLALPMNGQGLHALEPRWRDLVFLLRTVRTKAGLAPELEKAIRSTNAELAQAVLDNE